VDCAERRFLTALTCPEQKDVIDANTELKWPSQEFRAEFDLLPKV
jgi:hypothetical protein